MKCPRALSHQFPVKVMFMEVIPWQLPELSFDRRIFLKRISENKFWKRTSYNKHFSDDAILNAGIMANIHGWRDRFHYITLIFSKISKHPANHYELGNVLSVHLMFMCKGYGGIGDKNKSKLCKEMAKFRTTVSRIIEQRGGFHSHSLNWSCDWIWKGGIRERKKSNVIPSSLLESWTS